MRATGIISETTWDGKCPKCQSYHVCPIDADDLKWGNDDEGFCLETWTCNSCDYVFETKAKLVVTTRWVVEDL